MSLKNKGKIALGCRKLDVTSPLNFLTKNNFNSMEKSNWTLFEKIAFRFSVLYFGLNIIPFPLDELLDDFSDWYKSGWDVLVNWTGRVFFHTGKMVLTDTGAGDTLWSWVQQFDILLIAIIGTLIWSFLDKNRENYRKFKQWFDVYLRMYLFIMLCLYGFAKIFPSQFGTLPNFRLYQRMGDMSPMGLLWAFMAFSGAYQMFTGFVEVLGGYLLIFRPTMHPRMRARRAVRRTQSLADTWRRPR